jgi:hypothetical protein
MVMHYHSTVTVASCVTDMLPYANGPFPLGSGGVGVLVACNLHFCRVGRPCRRGCCCEDRTKASREIQGAFCSLVSFALLHQRPCLGSTRAYLHGVSASMQPEVPCVGELSSFPPLPPPGHTANLPAGWGQEHLSLSFSRKFATFKVQATFKLPPAPHRGVLLATTFSSKSL